MSQRSYRVESDGATDRGRVRTLNEDSFLMRPEIGLWAVADGMGGHDAGDYASQTMIGAFKDLEDPTTAPEFLGAIEASVIGVNRTLREAAIKGNGAHSVIGCTLATLVIFEGAYACIWSGDSRVYLVRHGAIEQISRDHTEAQELIDRGTLTREEARTWPRRNVITRAIGVYDEPELEMVQGRVEDGDVFVLCSDGLTEHLEDDEIAANTALRPLEKAVKQMIDTTLERGAKDNVTVIAVACREVTHLQPGAARTYRGEP